MARLKQLRDKQAGSEKLAYFGGPPAVPAGPPAWPCPDPEIHDALSAAYMAGTWGRYDGPSGQQLVQRLQTLLQIPHVLPCCSGTLGVELALRGMQVTAGDEVVLAAYDFPGNFRAIESIGATPVIVDIDPSSWCLDTEALAEALGPTTRAVIVSHLHGGLANMQQIVDLAHQHGASVVEDACQAHGAQVQGRPAGTWGDAGVLSFGGSKLLTAGRGGALLTSDPTIYQRAKVFGERGGMAFPLSELQATVLLPQIEKLAARNQMRYRQVARLIHACKSLQTVVPIGQLQPGIPSYYKVALSYRPAAHQVESAPVSRDELLQLLIAEGVAVGAGFSGFLRRSASRCKRVGRLHDSKQAVQSTILLHHPVLLQGDPETENVAHALEKVDRFVARVTN